MAEERLALLGLTMRPPEGVFHPVELDTTGGPLSARFYLPSQPRGGILWLDDTRRVDPRAEALYARLAERFLAFGVASLWLKYRDAGEMTACALDALVGGYVLQQQGLAPLVAVGHGQGASGAVQARAQFPEMAGVALLAPTAGTTDVSGGAAARPMVIQADGDLFDAADAIAEELSDWLAATLGLSNRSKSAEHAP